MSTAVLGIDIAKLKFDAALLENSKYRCKIFKNDPEGFEDLLVWLKEKGVQSIHACLESTGAYGEELSNYLTKQGFIVSVVNPAKIKGFAQSELARTKTDKADSKLIARYCQVMKPPVWQPLPEHIRELQDLVKRLETLQDIYQEEQNRLGVAADCIKGSIQEVSKMLAEKIAEIKQKITDHIERHPNLRAQKELLT